MEKGGGKSWRRTGSYRLSFEKGTYCAEIVRFMYAKEKEGMD